MSNKSISILKFFFSIVLFTIVTSCTNEVNNRLNERVKVVLRDVGHNLLLSSADSTSLVKPIEQLEDLKYRISFEEQLTIHPDSIVNIIKRSFIKADFPTSYIVEVQRCEDDGVVYSYEMTEDIENGIVPCGGRQLHQGCYNVYIIFTTPLKSATSNLPYYLIFIGIAIFLIVVILYKKRQSNTLFVNENNYESIGKYKFYPDQNKLIKEAIEISLSKKECELLAIFVANPNQIIKRDELTKRVWEDNGVIVGRSLDTYVSKLRKIFKDDDSIKLTNVHGVGYKLEVG